MKLYFTPGACSLSPHIALREAGLAFELEAVDLATKKTKSGVDYRTINPKGYVPTLELDDGDRLTEAAVIVQYIADLKPASNLAPPAGTRERYHLQEWLNFVATELHKGFGPLFNPKFPAEAKQAAIENIAKRLDLVEKTLEKRSHLTSERFTVADGYLFTILTWRKLASLELSKWPKIAAYFQQINDRPAVRAALEAERSGH